jgi:hypothetical protein
VTPLVSARLLVVLSPSIYGPEDLSAGGQETLSATAVPARQSWPSKQIPEVTEVPLPDPPEKLQPSSVG